MRIADLRALFVKTFRSDPPKAFGPDLLLRSIAHRLQEKAYGGLDTTTAKLLKKLVANYAKNPGKLILPRRIKPGATLVRKWKDRRYQVTIMEKGFAYEGKTYDRVDKQPEWRRQQTSLNHKDAKHRKGDWIGASSLGRCNPIALDFVTVQEAYA